VNELGKPVINGQAEPAPTLMQKAKNATILATRVVNWLPEFDGILFFNLGPNTRS